MGYWCNYIVNEYIPSSQSRQWQIPLAMQMVPSFLLVLAALLILPESPRFLVKKDQKNQARKVLGYVRNLDIGHEYINAEMEEIEDAIRRQENPSPRSKPGRFGLVRELWWKGNRRRVVIGLGLMFGQNLTGINGINFYTPTIFRSIGFDGTKVVLLASGASSLSLFACPKLLILGHRDVRRSQNRSNYSISCILHRQSRTSKAPPYKLYRHFASTVVYWRFCHSFSC
jgi:MFS family permease